jgi:hypothetical protein
VYITEHDKVVNISISSGSSSSRAAVSGGGGKVVKRKFAVIKHGNLRITAPKIVRVFVFVSVCVCMHAF